MRSDDARQLAFPFERDLLGHTVRRGPGRVTFSDSPWSLSWPGPTDAPGCAWFAAGQMQVGLIDSPLPCGAAMDVATGSSMKTVL